MMKNKIFILLASLMCLVGCSQEADVKVPETEVITLETNVVTQVSNTVRHYYMKTDATDIVIPVISLSEEENSFTFSYDILSSYLSVGSYENIDDKLILVTDDNKYKYVFEIVDEKILKFIEKESSPISLINKNSLREDIVDGTEFVLN